MIEIILAVLATYRLARMLALEEGFGLPFGTAEKKKLGVFHRFREWLDPKNEQDSWLARGINCPLCIGFWIALAITALVPFSSWQMFILTWLGIAGAQTIIYLVTEPEA